MLEEFYRFRGKTKSLCVDVLSHLVTITQEVARLAFIEVSAGTLRQWLGRVVESQKKVPSGDDGERQAWLLFMLSLSDSNSAVPSASEDMSICSSEALLRPLLILRLLCGASCLLGALLCKLQQAPPTNVSQLWCFNSPLREAEPNDSYSLSDECAAACAADRRNDSLRPPTRLPTQLLELAVGTELVRVMHGCLPNEQEGVRRANSTLSVADLARSLRHTWPATDVEYPLDWRSSWVEENEADFIRHVHRAIQRHENEER
ncbi:hypothetical protein DQ04_02171060 [Trypanosoma grayi]|uniref:hypothetical protein n=1 Tax=Trypanosoma grayi TaxID=71804 RepID=UPI0004F3FA37|nr:hypothetical protein DQ04_02171060 [Trypanosoma grayi]KEG11899.1 hypothetical protein DQ04_02171060 [Trypanosoma grayi]